MHVNPRAGVADGALYFQTVANNARVKQQLGFFGFAITRDFVGIKIIECGTIVFALTQHRDPRKPRLRALENQKLEQLLAIVNRYAPFLIVIATIKFVVSAPAAARRGVFIQDERWINRRLR